MRGHIAKKGNRYYVVVHEGPDPATGKPRVMSCFETGRSGRGQLTPYQVA